MRAIVHFRTRAAGSRKLGRGQRRGYWRVLLVRDADGSVSLASHNVVREIYCGRDGIDGATPRSAHYIGRDRQRAQEIADGYNAAGAQQ